MQELRIGQQYQGTVKWFNNIKGFGFITVGGVDVAAHHSEILMAGYRILVSGYLVSFELAQREQGLFAKKIAVPDDMPKDAAPIRYRVTRKRKR